MLISYLQVHSNQVMDLKLLHKECLHKDMVLLTKVTQLSNSQVMDHPKNKEVMDLLNKEVTHHLKSNQGTALLSNNQATRRCKVSTSMMVHYPQQQQGYGGAPNQQQVFTCLTGQ